MRKLRLLLRVQPAHRGDLVKFVIFMVVSAFLGTYLYVLAGNVRSGEKVDYHATFADVSGLEKGDDVRVASVSVGRVKSISIGRDNLVRVGFSLQKSIPLTQATTATVRYKNLVGDRYLSLDQPDDTSAARLPVGGTIPRSRTAAALELDTLLNGFKPLFVGLSPAQINQLSQQLILVLQGQASAVTTLVSPVNSFATTIGSRDELVGEVVDNLNTVLGTLDRRDDALGSIVDQLSSVVKGLDDQAPEVLSAAAQIDSLSQDASGLLGKARTDISPSLDSLRTTAKTLNDSEAMVEKTLRAYPDHYKLVLRTGSFGSFFNFFLCGVKVRLTDESEESNVVSLPWIKSDVTRCQR